MKQEISIDDQLKKAKNFANKGNILEAKECYQLILSIYPKNTRALDGLNKLSKYSLVSDDEFKYSINKLINFYSTAQYSKSLEYGNSLLLKYSSQTIILNILGATYTALEKYKVAIKQYQAALKIDPTNPQVHNNLGLTFKKIKDYSNAKKSFNKAIEFKPSFSEAYNNLGLTCKEMNQYDEALEKLNKAILLNSKYFEAIYNKGNLLAEQGQHDQAIKCYKNSIQINPNYYDAYNNLGTAEMKSDNDLAAARSFNKAIEIQPKFVDAYSNLCHLYEQTNDLDKLAKILEKTKIVKIDQDDEIRFRFAQFYARKNKYNKTIELLKNINDSNISKTIKIQKYTLLAKTFDKLKEYREGFKNFKKANQLVKNENVETKNYNPENYQFEIEQLIDSFSKSGKIHWSANKDNKNNLTPVFLIGFPRSGTTLLDNILGSHPDIITIEEKPMIANMKLKLKNIASYENLSNLENFEVNALRNVYFNELNRHVSCNLKEKVIIDKLPLNIVDIGLIVRVFPKAKFILSLRHPCDCVLSCFMQTFKINDAMANFLNLRDSANLYHQTMKLFEIYDEKFSLNYHIIKYEDLIIDLKKTTLSLLKSISLDWNDNLRNYQKTALSKRIKTPSYNQVTEKLYTRAKGRWENYKSEMKDVLPVLEYWIEKWRY